MQIQGGMQAVLRPHLGVEHNDNSRQSSCTGRVQVAYIAKSPVGLLKAIKSVMFNVESKVNPAHTFVMDGRKLHSTVCEAHWTIPQ